MTDDEVVVKTRQNRRRRSRRTWSCRRTSDVLMMLLKFVTPFVALIFGYDFVQTDAETFSARRVMVERQQADKRVQELAEKLDALLEERK